MTELKKETKEAVEVVYGDVGVTNVANIKAISTLGSITHVLTMMHFPSQLSLDRDFSMNVLS